MFGRGTPPLWYIEPVWGSSRPEVGVGIGNLLPSSRSRQKKSSLAYQRICTEVRTAWGRYSSTNGKYIVNTHCPRVVPGSEQRDFETSGKECSTIRVPVHHVWLLLRQRQFIRPMIWCTSEQRIRDDELSVQVGISHGSVHIYPARAPLVHESVCPLKPNKWAEDSLSACVPANNIWRGFKKKGNSFLLHIVAGDESIGHYQDPESYQESVQWKNTTSPPSKKSRSQSSVITIMLTFFLDCRGYLLIEFLPCCATVNADRYQTTITKP